MPRLFFDHALLADGWAGNVGVEIEGGWIRAVHPGAAPAGYERAGAIAVPGLASVHSHGFQRAMAGLAERRAPAAAAVADDSFWTWREVMYRFLARLSPEDVEAITALAYAEMLESGFTAVGEFHYLHNDPAGAPYANPAELSERVAAAAATTGIGLTLLPSLYLASGFGGAPPAAGQRRFIAPADHFARILEGGRRALANLDDASLGIAPHSLRAVPEAALRELLAAHPAGPVHLHIAEQEGEVAQSLAFSGERPVAWLLARFPVDARWCLVHATHMDQAETAALAATGATAGLCPVTEASLGDGIFPALAWAAAGGGFALGTDSNVAIGAAEELRQLETSQRLAHRARNVLGAPGASTGRRLFAGALAGGAQALGRRIGALAPGARADIVVLDATHPDLAVVSGDLWLDRWIFALGRSAIGAVYVGGERTVSAGRHRSREPILAAYGRALARLA